MFTVSPDCPNATVVNFTFAVSCGEVVWERNFSLRVDASVMVFESFLINDADTNFNGIIDPLETVKLVVNVNNNAAVQSGIFRPRCPHPVLMWSLPIRSSSCRSSSPMP